MSDAVQIAKIISFTIVGCFIVWITYVSEQFKAVLEALLPVLIPLIAWKVQQLQANQAVVKQALAKHNIEMNDRLDNQDKTLEKVELHTNGLVTQLMDKSDGAGYARAV